MRLLIAEDEKVTLVKLTRLVRGWGYDPVAVTDGSKAWDILRQDDSPNLALLDWHMPGRTGDDLCRTARAELRGKPLHIILLTATRVGLEAKVQGLGAGADDYLTKPYEPAELQARLRVGERLIQLELELRRRVKDLEEALAQVKQLQGLIPICMDCKQIRDDQNYWHQVERYIAERTDATFTHSLCPICFKKRLEELGNGCGESHS